MQEFKLDSVHTQWCYDQIIMEDNYIGLIEVNENVFTIIMEDNYLKACTACNSELIEHYKHEIDDYFSMDENLQTFIETINEKEDEK